MVKSLEQYLADLDFSPKDEGVDVGHLSAGERAFVEKYLGLDALEAIPRVDPVPMRQSAPPPPQAKVLLAEPEIKVAPPRLVVAPAREEIAEKKEIESPPEQLKNDAVHQESAILDDVDAAPLAESTESRVAAVDKLESPPVAGIVPPIASERINAVEPVTELTLRENLKQQDEIKAVSFFVAGQLFLLPVEGIQEVLRHMELVRVPQAPPFVAGVINLRDKVTPLVHLSAILTNVSEYGYDPEKNFIIIYGTEPLQIGLIIDRINSMHLLPQDKIIWNVEAKLGEAADFLHAIVNLDEKVCGMVAPEMITRKILAAEF